MSRYSRCRGDSSVLRASRVMPSTPFMGVRISWLMLARNSLLARFAACRLYFAANQGLFGALAADADGDAVGDRTERGQRRLGERLACEHARHAQQFVLHDQRMSSEGDDPFALEPVPIAHPQLAANRAFLHDDLARLAFDHDRADRGFAGRHASMRVVGRRSARAGLQLQEVARFGKRPEAGERGVEVMDEGFGAVLQRDA